MPRVTAVSIHPTEPMGNRPFADAGRAGYAVASCYSSMSVMYMLSSLKHSHTASGSASVSVIA